ncbi:UvrD-helicase domain-containing protein [Gracilibacillus dipsosauri]|uniref:UvrD-helicase domain-containing protein n=1 Tax=Gracilibacillus dipsosauri TaxID=178340 RepID=UPI00240A64A9
MPKIAIGAEFLKAMSNIPKSEQKRVREFTEKFRKDPTQSSINYEPIHDVKDKKVRTVRIGLSYRAVVLHPPKGDVYILVWVDHHDEAMRWAKNKVFEINSETGGLQIIDTEIIEKEQLKNEVADEVEESNKEENQKYLLFDEFTDKQLQKIGVPRLLLPSIRKLENEEELEQIREHLPDEAYEGLLSLAAGFSFKETLDELGREPDNEEIDPDDFEKALENPDTKRRFATVTSNEDLLDMLNAPLEKWRVFLHPTQEKIVKNKNRGPVRVLGGAGTGKTVAAMHRAKFLVEEVFTNTSDSIIFLTFTANLAKVINNQLDSIVPESSRKRIVVTTVHSLANRILKRYDENFQTVSSREVREQVKHAWEIAVSTEELGFDESFYREEWEDVVQRNGISSEKEYLRAKRIGRGTRISRLQRKQIWKVFEDYRSYLNRHNIKEWVDVVREARMVVERNDVVLPYKAAIIDEAQDLHQEDYKLIRTIIPEGPNDLFIVGDTHQRIYKNKVVLSHSGINVRGGRSKRLKVNYRTTEQIRKWAVSIIEGLPYDDLDEGLDDQKGYKSLLQGLDPEIRSFSTLEEELSFIKDFVQNAIMNQVELSNLCLVTRSNKLIEDVYAPFFKKEGIASVILNPNDTNQGEGIRLATMHRVKGLEFSHMIIASVNAGIMPPKNVLVKAADEVSRIDIIQREKSLLYVAATRARDYLVVTSYGEKSELLQG